MKTLNEILSQRLAAKGVGIVVYKTLSNEYRAHVKGEADKQAWGSTAERAVRCLIKKHNIQTFYF